MTTATQHTPGPWGLDHCGVDTRLVVVNQWGNAIPIANAAIEGAWDDDPEARANARLIAATPDLLAELEEIIDGWTAIEDGKVRMRRLTDWEEERLNFARALVRRARGVQS